MSENDESWAYRVSIEILNPAGETIGAALMEGGWDSLQGNLKASGACWHGADTPQHMAAFFDALARDLIGARPERLDS